jgi:hypothetical protein
MWYAACSRAASPRTRTWLASLLDHRDHHGCWQARIAAARRKHIVLVRKNRTGGHGPAGIKGAAGCKNRACAGASGTGASGTLCLGAQARRRAWAQSDTSSHPPDGIGAHRAPARRAVPAPASDASAMKGGRKTRSRELLSLFFRYTFFEFQCSSDAAACGVVPRSTEGRWTRHSSTAVAGCTTKTSRRTSARAVF